MSQQLPQVNDLVLARVKKILPYGAFCSLDEYSDHEAFLHISEVAPRWIKNIHEFLHEGQNLVCKVHRLTPEKDQVDISLKRVSESEKKRKVKVVRLEKRAKKLFEVCAKTSKSSPQEVQTAKEILEKKFGTLMDAFEILTDDAKETLEELEIPKAMRDALVEIINKSAKNTKATMREIVQIASYSPVGVEVVKKAIASIKTPAGCELEIHYLGAPRYQLTITAPDYKQAQKQLDKINKSILAMQTGNELFVQIGDEQ
jgi:translation initiation factor 2 subunit 1